VTDTLGDRMKMLNNFVNTIMKSHVIYNSKNY
jgi:hypothetical protein